MRARADDDALTRISSPFYATATRWRRTGLAIARKIVELHHGTINAQNRSEGGLRAYSPATGNDREPKVPGRAEMSFERRGCGATVQRFVDGMSNRLSSVSVRTRADRDRRLVADDGNKFGESEVGTLDETNGLKPIVALW